jgi:hypothetical protein
MKKKKVDKIIGALLNERWTITTIFDKEWHLTKLTPVPSEKNPDGELWYYSTVCGFKDDALKYIRDCHVEKTKMNFPLDMICPICYEELQNDSKYYSIDYRQHYTNDIRWMEFSHE